jgi:hypothetical protein
MMSRKKGSSQNDSRFEKLDRLIPLLGLGIAAYVAGRAAADRRAAERRLAQVDDHTAELLRLQAAPAVAAETPQHGKIRQSVEKLNRTKKFLILAMLTALMAYVMGGSTFATFSAETGNPGTTVASGTLTMSDTVNSGTVCNSYGNGINSNAVTSADNYNANCAAILALTNQAPGVTNTTGSYLGGYAQVVIANTGSINASLFSLFAPYVNGSLSTQVSSGALVGTGQTVTSFSVSSLEGPVSTNDKIILNYGSTTQEFCAGAAAAASSTTTSITISGGYAVAAGTSNACPGTSGPIAAGTTFSVGTRLNDTSTDTAPSNTDCWDAKTTVPGITNATKGTDLNFNPITGNPFCSTALFWIQEQSVVGANTYNYCWFGRGSPFGDQGGNTEDSAGECRTPTQMTLASNVTTGAATATTLNGAINNAVTSITVASGAGFSNGDVVNIDSEEMTIVSGGGTTSWTVTRAVNGTSASSHSNSAPVTKTTTASLNVGGTLHGNIKTNDQVTLTESGSTLTCYATGNSYIGSSSNVGVTGCYGAPSTTFDGSAIVKDATAFTNLNGSNPSSTISNFDTAHLATGAVFMPPLTANGTDNTSATVQLAAKGDANSKDIRTFYIGVYFPSPSGTNQNYLQGLMSTFGLTFHIDQ